MCIYVPGLCQDTGTCNMTQTVCICRCGSVEISATESHVNLVDLAVFDSKVYNGKDVLELTDYR